jgi:hypothetical protein
LLRTVGTKYFSQNRRVAGILGLEINSVADVVEKGFKARIAISFGGLFGALGYAGQKGQDFIWGDRFQFPVTKFLREAGEKKLIIFQRIFFSN